jgi:DNA-binding NtrC family response regulator
MPSAIEQQPARDLVGESPRICQLRRLIDKLGRNRWPALLLGETGTGKEVAARAIYGVQRRGPFVTIDCSSMVGPLMESELFGHVRGAFTGAVAPKAGLLELANGGTASFDEIGELPLDTQAKLLRVLQQKEFRPVGSAQVRYSDFRVIAATNRDLAREVEKGSFRSDLYYRLNVVAVRLAPLRDRREDIPGLIAHFLAKHGHGQRLSAEAEDVMLAYDWPGNVRELENTVLRMVALHSGVELTASDLPSPLLNIHYSRGGMPRWHAPAAESGRTATGPQEAPIIPLVEVEKKAILEAVEYTHGDRGLAAHLLGIGRTTLYRKLREYGVEA